VDYYDENNNKIRQLTCCSRCGGQGIIPIYANLYNGICFRCCGARYEEFIKEDYNKKIFENFNIPFNFKSYLF
jgi:hypothetical protein